MIGIVLLVFGLLGGTSSQAANITISDTVYDSGSANSWWNSPNEDQEVEPNMTNTQAWDLEAFVLQGSRLSMIGGFNFKNGVTIWGDHYTSGDIFIDVTGDVKYGAMPNTGNTTAGFWSVRNIFGYDYALHFNFNNNTYDLYALTPDSIVKTVDLSANLSSNPWRYKSGGTLLGTFRLSLFSGLSDAEVLALYGVALEGGDHYVVSLDLLNDFLSLGVNLEEFTLHFTEGCGNDNLMGYAQVPLPGSLVLLGSGLGCLGLLGLRRKKRSNIIGRGCRDTRACSVAFKPPAG